MRRSFWLQRRSAALARVAVAGGWRRWKGRRLGFMVEMEFRRWNGETEWRLRHGEARRSWRCKRSGAAVASAAARGGWSSPESGGAWARRGESKGGRGGLGKMEETDEGKTGGKAGSSPREVETGRRRGARRGGGGSGSVPIPWGEWGKRRWGSSPRAHGTGWGAGGAASWGGTSGHGSFSRPDGGRGRS
uniref:Retrotransposon protein, putative, Ty3-gypsy subclass n=1 Tax=Oryza sativa subsp. japonica TaxID=39947 RepID=Q2QR45_ORYSJ|nr:retrotransposon protein, putative, Ty3-gypsy subclass [Oryza sativa Japonica Group]